MRRSKRRLRGEETKEETKRKGGGVKKIGDGSNKNRSWFQIGHDA